MVYVKNQTEAQLIYIPRTSSDNEAISTGEYSAGENISISPSKVISVVGIKELINTKQDILISGENIKTINGESLLGSGNIEIQGGGEIPDFDSLSKVEDFLYDINYTRLDYPFAEEYFEQGAPINVGACSALRYGDEIGRHYDWLYNNQPSFIVHTPNCQGHYAVIGVAAHPRIDVDFVESRVYDDKYKVLPFYLQDGINENGLFAEINVVPASGNTQNTPHIEVRDRVAVTALVRYILDHYSTVQEALDDLVNYVQVYMPTGLTEMGYEAHLLLADGNDTKVLEMIDNQLVNIDSTISTNFHLYGVTANTDGSVYTNYTAKNEHFASQNGIEEYGSGLERWNLLNAGKGQDMRTLMNTVNFSKAYTVTAVTKCWYSEFIGGDYTTDTVYTEMSDRLAEYREKWAARDRDTAEVWRTRHSCVYSLSGRSFTIIVEEGDVEHNVALFNDYATKDWVEAQGYLTEHQSLKTINNQSLIGSGNITIEGGVGKSEGANKGEIFNIYTGGFKNTASGEYSHSEGRMTTASGLASHSEGHNTNATGQYSHSEGISTTASGQYSHSEGNGTRAMSTACHSEGESTTAYSMGAHSEGVSTSANGIGCHSEGYATSAEGAYSHSEGNNTKTGGQISGAHCEGNFNVYNVNFQHTVGIGTSDSARKNAHTITGDGEHYILGVGGYNGTQTNLSNIDDVATVINSKIDSTALSTAINSETARTESTYQKILTAGDNITINSSNVISVSGIKEWVEGKGYLTEHQSLEGYATETWVENKGYITDISGKQDVLISGTNIKTINNQSILGSGDITIQGGTEYEAGQNIQISGNVISAVDTTYTAGDNITITSNTISAVGNVASNTISHIWTGTQAEYDAIPTKLNNTLYFING